MKTYYKLFVCILLFNCSDIESQEVLITKFVEDIILQENLDYENWKKYIDFPKKQSYEGKKVINELITNQIKLINSKIKKNNNDYEIIPYKDLEKYNLSSKIIYKDLKSVYFLLSNKAIITPIIIKKGEIIAFFNGITKHKRNSYPWILNESNIIN